MVAAHDGAEACICDLTEPLGLSHPTVSHHLKGLVEAGILTRDRHGIWAYYALVPGALDSLGKQLVSARPSPLCASGDGSALERQMGCRG